MTLNSESDAESRIYNILHISSTAPFKLFVYAFYIHIIPYSYIIHSIYYVLVCR
jgi:hypothetical protein